jgi:hypothetical protein
MYPNKFKWCSTEAFQPSHGFAQQARNVHRKGSLIPVRDKEDHPMSKMPPVPPEQRSNKGPGSDPKFEAEENIPGRENFDTQGRQGNIKQNTTNQGYQQDR